MKRLGCLKPRYLLPAEVFDRFEPQGPRYSVRYLTRWEAEVDLLSAVVDACLMGLLEDCPGE